MERTKLQSNKERRESSILQMPVSENLSGVVKD